MSPLLHVVRSTATEEGERRWSFVGFSRIMDKFLFWQDFVVLFGQPKQNKTKRGAK